MVDAERKEVVTRSCVGCAIIVADQMYITMREIEMIFINVTTGCILIGLYQQYIASISPWEQGHPKLPPGHVADRPGNDEISPMRTTRLLLSLA